MAVVLLTAQGSIQVAVDAMKLGAYDFLQKPVDAARLRTILANATRQRDTAIELEVARRRLRETGVLGSMVGSSAAMREIFASDRTDRAVERFGAHHRRKRHGQGTGGAHAARSEPAQAAALCRGQLRGHPRDLIESEIFGHEKGSFTGAVERRAGCFELAIGRHAAAG